MKRQNPLWHLRLMKECLVARLNRAVGAMAVLDEGTDFDAVFEMDPIADVKAADIVKVRR